MKLTHERPLHVSHVHDEKGTIVAFVEYDYEKDSDLQEQISRRIAASFNICEKYALPYLELIAQSDACVLPMVKHKEYLAQIESKSVTIATMRAAINDRAAERDTLNEQLTQMSDLHARLYEAVKDIVSDLENDQDWQSALATANGALEFYS